jgi:hypothetical protein
MLKVELHTNTNRPAFAGDKIGPEIARILRKLADNMEAGEMPETMMPDCYYMPLFDSDGEIAGGAEFELTEEEYSDWLSSPRGVGPALVASRPAAWG